MKSTLKKDLENIFNLLTLKERIKNKRLYEQSKKLKQMIDRIADYLNQNFANQNLTPRGSNA